jgi:hypothetical protein
MPKLPTKIEYYRKGLKNGLSDEDFYKFLWHLKNGTYNLYHRGEKYKNDIRTYRQVILPDYTIYKVYEDYQLHDYMFLVGRVLFVGNENYSYQEAAERKRYKKSLGVPLDEPEREFAYFDEPILLEGERYYDEIA